MRSIPLRVFQSCEGQHITVELKNGTTYSGVLDKCSSEMNCVLTDVTCTLPRLTENKAPEKKQMESVFLRGSRVMLIVLPKTATGSELFVPMQAKREVLHQRTQIMRQRRKQSRLEAQRKQMMEQANAQILPSPFG